jgi:phosphoglycerol transferase MdoB-like AlkP superfamily enzyme
MKRKLTALLIYSLFWMFFFIFARIFFLIVQFRELISYSPSTILETFIYGFRLDLSATAYILLIPMLVSVGTVFFQGKWYLKFLKIYSYALIIIFSGLVLSDAAIYAYWGFRIEFSVMGYLKNPADAAASVSTLQMILLVLVWVVFSYIFILIYNRFVDRFIKEETKPVRPLLASVIIFILTASMVIPIRGGLRNSPVNAGSVYFSKALFPNHAAINIVWNFGHTAIYSKPARNPYMFTEAERAYEDVNGLLKDSGSTVKVINSERPNVLLIIIESFGSFLTDQSAADSVVTPRFREYVHKGLYFTNIYAAGSRTDKAIPAILSGYPNLPLIQVIREPDKTRSMPGIIKMLDSAGYKTSFWYGGDINFANLDTYLTESGFRQKITKKDFSPEECKSKWGAHDEILLDRLQDSLPGFRQPFACAVLTLSSHEPFEVPMEPVFKGENILSKFKNSVYYTDRSLGNFLDKASKTEWWKNTLVILMADHCRRNTVNVPVYSGEIFKIPMLWLGGAVNAKDVKINKVGNQFDLPLTLANQLNMKTHFLFSKDLLSTGSSSFAFYTYNEGFAFITDTTTAVYDIKMKKNVLEKGNDPERAAKLGKSFLQVLFDDYLSR